MAKKCPKCECPAGEKWAVPFADFLSLLLALFIALYALASVNIEKQKVLKEEFMKIYDFNTESDTLKEQEEPEKSKTTEPSEEETLGKQASIEESISKMEEIEKEMQTGGSLMENQKEFFLNLPGQLVFESGKAELSDSYTQTFIKKLTKLILLMPEDTVINVKGYAEESEAKGSGYKDSLDLSSARSNNVIRELLKNGIPSNRVYSTVYGATKSNEQSNSKVVEFEFKSSNVLEKESNPDVESIFQSLDR